MRRASGVVLRVKPEHAKLLGYWGALERIHRGYDEAAARIEGATGGPLCVPGCDANCCEHNSVLAYGIEAELAASHLLGQPAKLRAVLDACHAWLTKPGRYTYGGKITPALWDDLRPEFLAILRERCPLLTEDKRCALHAARPLVCRAYGVTRVPARECPRPWAPGENHDNRLYWDGTSAEIPLYKWVRDLRRKITEPRYSRQGFFATMLYERFRASELAGLLDDGKVPLLKLAVGWGDGYQFQNEGHMLLWQEQLEREWRADAADKSIAEVVPLEERPTGPVMVMRQGGL